MGSSTTLSSAKRASQAARSPASTAAIDCLPQLPGGGHDRTLLITSSANRRRLSSLVWSDFGVRTHGVRPAEPHDHVGDALLLESPDAVDRVGVEGDHVHLEGPVRRPLLLAQPAQALEQSGQVGGIPTPVEPAVRTGRPAQGRGGVAPDQDGQRLGGRGGDLHRGEVVDLTVVLEVAAGREPLHDGHRLVHPLTAALPGHVDQLVVLRPRAGPHAERQPVAGHHRNRGGLLGDQQRDGASAASRRR